MSEFKYEYGGFDELSKMFKELKVATRRGIFRKAFRDSIGRFHSELTKTTAWKNRSGELRSTMDVKNRVRKGAVVAGVEGPYYGRFLEFGWIPGKRPGSRSLRAKRAVAALNFVERDPWIAPVFERLKEPESRAILGALEKEILTVFRKYSKSKSKGK